MQGTVRFRPDMLAAKLKSAMKSASRCQVERRRGRMGEVMRCDLIRLGEERSEGGPSLGCDMA